MSPTTRKVTVETASSSPSSPPAELPSRSTEAEGADKAGSASGSESEGEWDPSAEKLPGDADKSKRKGKGKEHDDESGQGSEKEEEQPWQAVWSPEQNGEPSDAAYSDCMINKCSLLFLEHQNW